MSFSDASHFDNALDMIYGKSSTIPPSHGKASARTPTSRPRGRQTPKPPRTSGFPRQPVTPTIAFNVNGYKLRRGDCFLPYPLLAEVSGWAQSKTVHHDRFKDLYLRDFVHAGKMIWGTGIGTWSRLSGPTSKATLMKAVDKLVWANSQMLGCRGIFTVGLLQPLEFDIAVRGPKTG